MIYQEQSGERQLVSGRFVQRTPTQVGFEVGKHDPLRPLVIDPTVLFSTLLGGNGNDSASGVALDAAGSIYLSGTTSSVDFQGGAGTLGSNDAFVLKLDPTGSTLQYVTYVGGSSQDSSSGVGVDGNGNATIGGTTSSQDFPTSAGAFPASFAGGSSDLFVSKFDAFGALSYSSWL